jgi:penicillin-binding protein 1C
LALTLGGGEVTLFQLARAYNALLHQGELQNLQTVLSIKNPAGEELYASQESSLPRPQLSGFADQNIAILKDILSDNQARLQSFGEDNILELPFPAAVKTGTTRNFKDNWAVGFSNSALVAVWVGNPDASSMQNISGIDGAGPIWNSAMQIVHQEINRQILEKGFKKPNSLNKITVCALSGMQPGNCPNQITELFRPGTEPKKDTYYQEFNCAGTQKFLPVYPPEYTQWAETNDQQIPTDCQLIKPIEADEATSTTAPLIILAPLNNDTFKVIPNLPPESQKITLKLQINRPLEKLEIYLNSQKQDLNFDLAPGIKTLKLTPPPGQFTITTEAQEKNQPPVKSKINLELTN